MTRRIVKHGVTLILDGGIYRTEDGRYEISKDNNAVTYCNREHPVRISRWKGYLCPGNEEHSITLWNVWDTQIDDHAFGDVYDTMDQAIKVLAQHLEGK